MDLSKFCKFIASILKNTVPPIFVDGCNILHVLLREFKREDVQVFAETAWVAWLWYDSEATLDLPPDADLRYRLLVRFGNPLQDWLVENGL